ncbi:MAG: hypothetical protein HeimC2_44100 [Candidatus Heimdallarchaeota archaeon LC_2]|nr:MAG: hypothetical protein HeimC2_44100 [Candidatus Heimdallarchaeota archaeon LC_2]
MTQIEEQINRDQEINESISVQITTIDINRDISLFQFFSRLNNWYKIPILAGDPHLFGFHETVVFQVDEYILPEIFHFNPSRRCYIEETDNQELFYLYFDKESKLNDIKDLRLILGCTSEKLELRDTQQMRFESIIKHDAMVLTNQIITHNFTHEELDFFIKETLELDFNILRSAEVDHVIQFVHLNSWRYFSLYNCIEKAAREIIEFQQDRLMDLLSLNKI